MAPSAVETTAVQAALDDVVSKPPDEVVLPPKDIRAIVEKTAGYVARNGPVFEDRIREKEIRNPKFSFLSEDDAYYPFYAWRLNEVREGRGTAVSAGRVGEETPKQPEKPKGPEQPPDFTFSARMPNISAQDLDVVKLTALFVARNGRAFATTLARKESTRSQFDFLRPQHSLYQFFTRLVDQYTTLLNGGIENGGEQERKRIDELDQNVKNKFNVLERARKRAEWVKFQEAQKQEAQAEAEAEKLAFAQIDWHDFVVVETIVFTEEDAQTDLPPPTSLSDLQSASLDQKASMSLAPHNMRIEEAMPSYEDYSIPIHAPPPPPPAPEVVQFAYPVPVPELQSPPPQPQSPQIPLPQPTAAQPGPTIKTAPVPRAMARRRNVPTQMCPNCKQQIPLDEMEQHMRVELLDPSWKEQRAKADARYAMTNLSTADVANNLKRLASQRTDVFDPITGRPLSEEEQNRLKKPATTYVGAADVDAGKVRPTVGQNATIDEQIKSIHERYAH